MNERTGVVDLVEGIAQMSSTLRVRLDGSKYCRSVRRLVDAHMDSGNLAGPEPVSVPLIIVPVRGYNAGIRWWSPSLYFWVFVFRQILHRLWRAALEVNPDSS